MTRNCECCGANYGTGKDYGSNWSQYPNPSVETKGMCEMCNQKSEFFCCKKHGTAFKIGHFWYRPENNFEKSNEKTN